MLVALINAWYKQDHPSLIYTLMVSIFLRVVITLRHY
jgi:hypothetical protein